MKLTIERDPKTSDNLATMGVMFVDGVRFCFTMEPGRKDTARPKGPIPAGLYNVNLLPSAHFGGKILPHLSNQPDKVTLIQNGMTFSFVMIHAGNYEGSVNPKTGLVERDSEGCILVGQSEGKDILNSSDAELEPLIAKIAIAIAQGPVYAEVIG